MSNEDKVKLLEERFKVVCSSEWNLSKYPLTNKDAVQFDMDKDKSRIFAEVFTPLHIVDQMLDTVPQMTMKTRNLDLCSGYGQFSIRILRKLFQVHGEKFNVGKYLTSNHFFAELQVSSCYKLLSIFSTSINLFIGDALKLGKLPTNAKGIWVYLEALDEWVNVTGFVTTLFSKISPNKKSTLIYDVAAEEKFVTEFNSFVNKLTHICKDYKMNIKEIARTKEGRQGLIKIMRENLNASKTNWQDVSTPENYVGAMVRSVPDIKALKKILVLFNIEFLECLVKESGINPSCVTFISDTEVESELAKKIYGAHSIVIVEHTLAGLKAATSECEGYDVIFSNPPYQINDGGGNGTSAVPIYHEIVMHAIDYLKPHYLCMITPSRWMSGGRGLDKYRARMLADKRVKVIRDYPGNKKVFLNTNIAGGVSYFLWDRDYSGLCAFNGSHRNIGEFDVLIRDTISCEVLRDVLKNTKSFCMNRVLPLKPFGLRTNFKDWVESTCYGATECLTTGRVIKYVTKSSFLDPFKVINLWKVIINNTVPGGQTDIYSGSKPLLTGFRVLSPNQICTETYVVVGTFHTETEAENYICYMKTKFFRFMVSLRLSTHILSKDRFAWVPDMRNYNKVWTDAEMYQSFKLNPDGVELIEKSIKAIK